MSHEGDSSQPSRALFSRMSQAEALNDELLKLLQNNNINFEQPEGQSENMNLSAVGQGSAPGQTLPPETKPEALRAKNAQLEGVFKPLTKQEQDHRPARQEREALVFHLKKKHRRSPNRSKFGRLHQQT